jgi:hypothetical protein
MHNNGLGNINNDQIGLSECVVRSNKEDCKNLLNNNLVFDFVENKHFCVNKEACDSVHINKASVKKFPEWGGSTDIIDVDSDHSVDTYCVQCHECGPLLALICLCIL